MYGFIPLMYGWTIIPSNVHWRIVHKSELQCLVAEVPSYGRRCGFFSGCRCAKVWLRLYTPSFSIQSFLHKHPFKEACFTHIERGSGLEDWVTWTQKVKVHLTGLVFYNNSCLKNIFFSLTHSLSHTHTLFLLSLCLSLTNTHTLSLSLFLSLCLSFNPFKSHFEDNFITSTKKFE